MKYTNSIVGFSEVPNEISLCISISNCSGQCIDCHSPELREDIGKPLNWDNLNALINIHKGITCVCFLGGDRTPEEIDKLARHIKRNKLKVCWYSGKETISNKIDIKNFDYIKVGPYIKEKGPINNPNTNQIMYEVVHLMGDIGEEFELEDITYKFWNKTN